MFNKTELEYLYHLTGNTSFNAFSERCSRFVSKEFLDELSDQQTVYSAHQKIEELLNHGC